MWRWLPLLAWMAIIFYFSHQPSEALPSLGVWDLLLKKGAHFVAYAIFAGLAFRVTGRWQRPFLWAFLLTAVYAAGDEFHQSFVPGRNPSIIDVFIDVAGGIAMLGLLALRSRRQRATSTAPRP